MDTQKATAEELLAWAAEEYRGRIAFASSLGLEDQVLTDMIARAGLAIPIFTIDTGRLFGEAYELIERTRDKYGIEMQVYFPNPEAVEALVNEHGPNLFRKSVALRKACCHARKVEPLQRALTGLDAWVTGLRSGQAATRAAVPAVHSDEANGLIKINPLHGWDAEQVQSYITQHKVPYNPLHDKGFPSIGCACCTRAVAPGEDIRAGRWWWENPEHKECGLHRRG